MAKKDKKPGSTRRGRKPPKRRVNDRRKPRRTERVITAKDAGWLSPSVFVLPMELEVVDPPEPIKLKKKRR